MGRKSKKMSNLKTQETQASVTAFIQTLENKQRQDDAVELLSIMEELTNKKGKMWGTSIIGFGKYYYKNTGKGGAWPISGFSPRKTALTLYVMSGFSQIEPLLAALGNHKVGKSCLYIKSLNDVDRVVLKEIITHSINYMQAHYSYE